MVATSEVEYEADGGAVMIGHLAVPDDAGAALPAVLVAHEAPGLDDVHRERADRLAERGYVAFALDAHGAGRFRLDDPHIRERVAAISNDPGRARSIAASALEVLRGNPRVDTSQMAAIGYCFGGTLVLELARGGADLRAVVGFHPGLGTSRPEDAGNITGTVLVCVGSEDPYVDGNARAAFEAEMRAGGVDWRMHLYGGVQHSFTHPHADRAGIPACVRPGGRRPGLASHARLVRGGPRAGRRSLSFVTNGVEASAPKLSLRREGRFPASC